MKNSKNLNSQNFIFLLQFLTKTISAFPTGKIYSKKSQLLSPKSFYYFIQMKQNLLNFKLSTLEKVSWTFEAMVQHSSELNVCIVWPAGRTNVNWIKCKHTITYFSSHPHSKQYNAYAKSMPAVGGQTLNDWTETAEIAEWAYAISVLCI